MTPAETITILRLYNEWRQGGFDLPQPDPNQITAAIDAAVEMIERLSAAEKERDNANAAAAGVALHAGAMQDRLDAAEKSDAESLAMYRRARDERDELRAALTDLLNDLEERAPLNIEKSPRVVACGNSVYVQAKAALEATP